MKFYIPEIHVLLLLIFQPSVNINIAYSWRHGLLTVSKQLFCLPDSKI